MKEKYFLMFLKGILIGIANAVPGISGGTIAFITGIFERLVKGISDVGVFLKEFFSKIIGKNKKTCKKIFGIIDWKLFIPLMLGVLPAIYLFSILFSSLMQNYQAFILSFFVGLILASAVVVYKKIKKHDALGIIIGVVGLIVGFLISIIPTSSNSANPSFLLILIIGAVASITMILPGISGAFVVLLFGKLDFMYNAVANFTKEWAYLVAFALGSIIGLIAFAKFLTYLLKKYHSYTLFALTGLIIGALYKPVTDILPDLTSTSNTIVSVVLVIVGIAIVFVLEKVSNK